MIRKLNLSPHLVIASIQKEENPRMTMFRVSFMIREMEGYVEVSLNG